MVDVDRLNVPPRTIGEDVFVDSLARDVFSGKSVRTFRAQVLDGTPTSTGRVRVLIDGTATTAKLRSTAKAVRTGDNVEVVKTGGIWHVAGADTWHEPPQVSGSMGSKPPAGTTVSGSNLPSVSRPTSFSPSQDPAVMGSRILNIRNRQRDDADRLHAIHQRLNAIQSALNTNASRLNQTRDYASNAGQLVEPVVGALRDEGIVR